MSIRHTYTRCTVTAADAPTPRAAYVSIREHTCAYAAHRGRSRQSAARVQRRRPQETGRCASLSASTRGSAASRLGRPSWDDRLPPLPHPPRSRGGGTPLPHTSAYVSIRQHTRGYASAPYVSIRQHTSAYEGVCLCRKRRKVLVAGALRD